MGGEGERTVRTVRLYCMQPRCSICMMVRKVNFKNTRRWFFLWVACEGREEDVVVEKGRE